MELAMDIEYMKGLILTFSINHQQAFNVYIPPSQIMTAKDLAIVL